MVTVSDSFGELLAELPLGAIELTDAGDIVAPNSVASALLKGPGGEALSAVLPRMCARVKETSHSVEASVNLPSAGQVRVRVAELAERQRYVAILERSDGGAQRAEVTALRAMLAATTSADPSESTIRRSVELLASSLPGAWALLFERDVAQLRVAAHAAVPAAIAAHLGSPAVVQPGSLAARVLMQGRPMFVANAAGALFDPVGPREQLAGLAVLALPIRAKEGVCGVLYVCGPPARFGQGELRRIQGTADGLGAVMQRTHAEQTLAAERRALFAWLDNLPDVVIEQADDGRISLAAGPVEAILGRKSRDVVGQRLEDLVAPADVQRLRAAAALPGSAAVLADMSVQRPDGRLTTCEIALHVKDAAVRGTAVRAVIRDQTHRRALEAEAARALEVAASRERLATLGQLVTGVAHEINNPLAYLKSNLASIIGYVEDLRGPSERAGSVSADEAAAELRDIVSESLLGVNRIVELVQALKGTGRQRPSERINFDPARAVQEAVVIFRGAWRSNCTVECALPSLPEVLGSPSALGQVVLNLLQNGLDAMGGKGTLRVEAERLEGRVRVSVQDFGHGIPADVQETMFEPFFTTKEAGKGTGLGLYLCKQIVEEMHGDLRFHTSPAGTTFTVDLPEPPQTPLSTKRPLPRSSELSDAEPATAQTRLS